MHYLIIVQENKEYYSMNVVSDGNAKALYIFYNWKGKGWV